MIAPPICGAARVITGPATRPGTIRTLEREGRRPRTNEKLPAAEFGRRRPPRDHQSHPGHGPRRRRLRQLDAAVP
jgi:hypothetical protein